MGKLGRVTGKALVSLLLFLGSAEWTARVEELIRFGTPVLSTPDRFRDLVVRDDSGVRGRPNGQYQGWRLNSFGFRGPAISELPAPGLIRVMTLGASETFGLFNSDGKEFPAQLERILSANGRYEVVNAAIPGLALRPMIQFWSNWGARFRPRVVVIYPTPHFYLEATAPVYARGPVFALPWWSPRLPQAVRDRFEYPPVVQRWRLANRLADRERRHPADWPFRVLPDERLRQFTDDLEALVTEIQAQGAQPIVATHAVGFTGIPSEPETDALVQWAEGTGRATPPVMLEFERACARETVRVALRRAVPIVDLAGRIGGQRIWFTEGDYRHFNDEGAAKVAHILADTIISVAK